MPEFLDVAQALAEDGFIDIAQGGNLDVRHLGIVGDMRPALPAYADAGHTHTIAGGARGARIQSQPYGARSQ